MAGSWTNPVGWSGPPEGLGEFSEAKTAIHGITAEMVAGAPPWRKVVSWIAEYTGRDTLICHNATFTIGALSRACAADNVPPPVLEFLCTMIMARQEFRLPSYRLPFVAAECGVELTGRHQVLINARGAALVAVALARQYGTDTPSELADALSTSIGCLEPGRYVRSAKCRREKDRNSKEGPNPQEGSNRLVAPDISPDADQDHPLYGRVIVFTGALKSRTRQQAWDDAGRFGAVPEKNITKRTNILVIGDLNPAVLAPGATTSGKAAHAFELQAKGQDIEVMTEDDFLRVLT